VGGIAGCVVPSGAAPDRAALERLAAALAHRGPDGTRIVVNGNAGLIETRLAITAAKPQDEPESGPTLVMDGEVIDPPELRAGELLRAIGELGTGALEPIDGRFAIALLDPDGGQLVLARSGVGMKPLHWAKQDGVVWFASETQALLAAGVRGTVRTDVLRRVASLGWEGRPETLVDPVMRLMPGCAMRIDLRSLECALDCFYDLTTEVDPELQAELAARPRDQLIDMLDAHLGTAVEARLGGEHPVAFFTSGGIDSSVITAMGERQRPGGTAFVASYRSEHVLDEAPYARILARDLGMDLEVIEVTAESCRAAFVDAIFAHGAPMSMPVALGLAQVSAAVSRAGLKAAIVGNAADAIFGGDWGRHRREFQAFLDFQPARERMRRRLGTLRDNGAKGATASVRRRLGRGPRPAAAWTSFGATLEWEDEETMRAVHVYGDSGPRGALAGRMLSDFPLNLTQGLVRFDANVSQFGVESRSPYLDRELLRFAFNAPLEQRVCGADKGILTEVAKRYVPKATMKRPKMGGMLTRSNDWLTSAARPEFLRDGMLPGLLEVDSGRWRDILDTAPRDQVLSLWTTETWARLTLAGKSREKVEEELWAR
jgi:asparagine synthase (glutamine-hydrolysing)